MLTRSRLQRPQDAGATLIELVVAMGVSVIVGVISVSFFVQTTKQSKRSVEQSVDTGQARSTLDSWTNLIRVAAWQDPANPGLRFEEITPTKLVFWANLLNRGTSNGAITTTANQVTKISLELVKANPGDATGRLIEVQFQQANPSAPAFVRELATQVKPIGTWLFTPHAVDGTTLGVGKTYCVAAAAAVEGMCYSAPVGMVDPTVNPTTHAVNAGTYSGVVGGPADVLLQQTAFVDIGFTVLGQDGISAKTFTSSASVNSGFIS